MPLSNRIDASELEPEVHTIESKIVYKNRWMTVREDRISRRGGTFGIYGIVEKSDFVVIAAVQDDQIYLVEQFRYPVKGRYWEMPQGSWEKNDIDPLLLATAELREETGLVAKSMVCLGHLFLAYGYSTQGFGVYFATQLEQLHIERETEEEDIIVKPFSVNSFERMISDGIIKDATTIAAFGLLRLKGLM